MGVFYKLIYGSLQLYCLFEKGVKLVLLAVAKLKRLPTVY